MEGFFRGGLEFRPSAAITTRCRRGLAAKRTIWGNIAVTQPFLALSEGLGQTDILLADGRAVEDEGRGGADRLRLS